MNPPACSAFAVLTPPGRGGIAVIRCIGPGAAQAVAACFRPSRPPASGQPPGAPPAIGPLAYGHVVDEHGRPLDEVILYRAGPGIFEVNCHGGPAAVRAVSQRLAALGLESVDPDTLLGLEGAGRIERDARHALRSARTELAARILLDQLNGALAKAIGEVRAFLGSESPRPAAGGSQAESDEAGRRIEALLVRWEHAGRFLAEPPRITVAGRPNVGKSTLVNRLAGADHAITSAVPGTTRDTVEVEAAAGGVPVVLVDTAGLREATEAVEREGVERAQRELRRGRVVLYLLDATEGRRAEDAEALAAIGPRALVVWNKADLAATAPGAGEMAVSARTGEGIPALVAEVLRQLGWRPPAPGEAVPFTPAQAEALAAAREAVAAGRPPLAADRLQPLR